MTKNQLLDYLEKLTKTLEQSERKNYIVTTRLTRTILLLQQYNISLNNDILGLKINELDNCNKTGRYGSGGAFEKDDCIEILKQICQIL